MTSCRFFKKVIYSTNHRHPEKDLLSKENRRQTLRLALADAFKHTEPVATKLIKDIYTVCPQLFASVLPRSEQMTLDGSLAEDDDDDDDEIVLADSVHLNPSVTGCIPSKFIRSEYKLPTRASELRDHTPFARALTASYGRDYGMPNIFSFKGSFAYCKKFGFYDRSSQRRLTFKMGDFIRQASQGRIMRIDQIFVHSFDQQRRLFVKTTPLIVDASATSDPVLGPGFSRLCSTNDDTGMHIAGLPSVDSEHLYVVPINAHQGNVVELASVASHAQHFLWAQYTVAWL